MDFDALLAHIIASGDKLKSTAKNDRRVISRADTDSLLNMIPKVGTLASEQKASSLHELIRVPWTNLARSKLADAILDVPTLAFTSSPSSSAGNRKPFQSCLHFEQFQIPTTWRLTVVFPQNTQVNLEC